MNNVIETTSIVLVVANLYFTWQGLQNASFQQKYSFWVDKILIGKEYIRMLSSGFLHVGWMHFAFNMYCLYSFSHSFDRLDISIGTFLVIYFGSLLGGNALALYIHKNHGDYRAVGASGAISGVVYAVIMYDPFGSLNLFFVLPIYKWLFAILYTLVSIYGIQSQRDNIGHEAHLGGAVIGMLIALLLKPAYLNYPPTWLILAILVPIGIFFYLILAHKEMMLIPDYWKKRTKHAQQNFKVKRGGLHPQKSSTKTKKSGRFNSKEDEVNYLLEKGWANLTAKEKKRFEELSRQTDK